MKTIRPEAKGFLRKYFCIPQNKKLLWGIVKEVTDQKEELRIALLIKDSRLYLDVARRCFCTVMDNNIIHRTAFPARRKKEKCRKNGKTHEVYCFYVDGEPMREVPVTYFADIYYAAICHEELFYDQLF